MPEMHLIMDGWRGYLLQEHKNQALLEDTTYITGVLGVALPLTESGAVAPLSEELKKQILHEPLENLPVSLLTLQRELKSLAKKAGLSYNSYIESQQIQI